MTDNALTVPMTTVTEDGLKITKTFYFERGKHSIDVNFEVENSSPNSLEVQPFYQLKQQIAGEEASMMMPTYRGAVFSTNDEAYEKYDFDDMLDANLNKATVGGYVGMIQHYFVSAWVPAQDKQNAIYSRVTGNNAFAIVGVKSPAEIVNAGETLNLKSTLFAGPKNQAELDAIHKNLGLTVDYGFLWFISILLFDLLVMINDVVGNWGIAIILITIVVKTLLYPLTKKQYTSMAKMRALQPKMEQLKSRFGDDRQKMGQAMMELYKKEKVNPLAGCLPILIQIPVFFSLYKVLFVTIEMRHAPFFGWIQDLSAPDPTTIFNLFGLIPWTPPSFLMLGVWPILMGFPMFVQMKMNPAPADPMQQKIFAWMPLIFTFVLAGFPAGLVIYWAWNNFLSVLQQGYIMRRHGVKIELWDNLRKMITREKSAAESSKS